MSLQDYYPSDLVELIRQATIIKPKVIKSYHTYLLTALGQVLTSLDGVKFTLWQKEPVQDISIDTLTRNVILITLDARILYRGRHEGIETYDINDVISIAYDGIMSAVTNSGELYTRGVNDSNFTLINLPEPVVATAGKSLVEFFLLRTDGRVWEYSPIQPLHEANDVDSVAELSLKVLLRDDRRIYEAINTDFMINHQVSDIVAVNSASDGIRIDINLITRSGQVLRKTLTRIGFGGNYKSSNEYKKVTLPPNVTAIACTESIVVLSDGRVARTENVTTVIPLLNIFTYYT